MTLSLVLGGLGVITLGAMFGCYLHITYCSHINNIPQGFYALGFLVGSFSAALILLGVLV